MIVPLHPDPKNLDYCIVLPNSEGPRIAWVLCADHYESFDLRSVGVDWDGEKLNIHAIVHFRDIEKRDAYLRDAL
jgi:hypothetical protein